MKAIQKFEQLPDADIIKKILEGEPALFELLIRRNNPYLYKIGRSYGYSHEDTQDLMQETFINAYVNLSAFENRSSLKTWLIRIMLNNCAHKLRKFSFTKEKAQETINENSMPMFSNTTNDTSKTMLNRELNHVIENAMQRLPEEYKMVFALREINGLNGAETAEALNISEGNVKARLSRAKTMLRKEIASIYTAEDLFEFNLIYCDDMVNRVMSRINDLNSK